MNKLQNIKSSMTPDWHKTESTDKTRVCFGHTQYTCILKKQCQIGSIMQKL